MTATADGVVESVKFCDKSCIGLDEAGNGREMRVHKVNR